MIFVCRLGHMTTDGFAPGWEIDEQRQWLSQAILCSAFKFYDELLIRIHQRWWDFSMMSDLQRLTSRRGGDLCATHSLIASLTG